MAMSFALHAKLFALCFVTGVGVTNAWMFQPSGKVPLPNAPAAPVLYEKGVCPTCLGSLRMATPHREASSSLWLRSPSRDHRELYVNRRNWLTTVPFGAGCLLLPSVAGADGWFNPPVVGNPDENGVMQWPEPLTEDSVVTVGKGRLPAVGFGMYNTKPQMAEEAVSLALEAGVRSIDTATSYGNEKEIGRAWKASGVARSDLALISKLSNTDLRSGNVRKAVETSLKNLQSDYLDAYYIHTPFASSQLRENAWEEMHKMQKEGLIRACGLSNFGVTKIKLLTDKRLPPPDLIQAEISPFNQRRDLVSYANSVNAKVVCAAWSKLSNKDTGAKGWGQLADVCATSSMTKAQGLVRWSLDRGLMCIPRSGTGSEAEIKAIKDENSPRGMKGKMFSAAGLAAVDALGVEMLATGKLGRTDGWAVKDVTGDDFDPTTIRLPLVGW